MPTFVLTDASNEVWVDSKEIDPPALGLGEIQPFSVKKHTLRGGRREGVDLIVVDNGALRFSVVPTPGHGSLERLVSRESPGLGLADRRRAGEPRVREPGAHGGLGWLEGFDELLARCGLENNGAPFEVESHETRRVEESYDVRAARADREYPRLVRGGARRRRPAA